MKKLLLALGLLLAVGGGCVGGAGDGGSKTVEGDWYLAFDLPNDWVMTRPYQSPTTETVVPLQEVDREDVEVYLQSTDKAILIGGVGANEDVAADSYVTLEDSHLQIRVSRLDTRRVVPSEAEELGNGFSRVKLCEAGDECQIYGRHNYDYYLQTDAANYKFIVMGSDIETAEDVIMSAEVVTIPEEDETAE